jgi:hypothetical protein
MHGPPCNGVLKEYKGVLTVLASPLGIDPGKRVFPCTRVSTWPSGDESVSQPSVAGSIPGGEAISSKNELRECNSRYALTALASSPGIDPGKRVFPCTRVSTRPSGDESVSQPSVPGLIPGGVSEAISSKSVLRAHNSRHLCPFEYAVAGRPKHRRAHG